MADEKKERRPRGPEPDHLKIGGDWEQAVRKALKKKKITPPARPKRKRRRSK